MTAESSKTPKNSKQVELEGIISANGTLSGALTRLPDHKWTGYGLTYSCEPGKLLEVVKLLRDDTQLNFNMLIDVTAVDWLDSKEKRFEVVYNFLSTENFTRLCLKVAVSEDKPEVASLVPLWNSANFLEREVYDMYGIKFQGHPDLRRILMYDEFVGHPLRKDYPLKGKQPRVNLRVPELHNTSADLHREALVSLPTRRYPTVEEKLAREGSK